MSRVRNVGFDGWRLRMDVGELTKGDRRIRLQDQPLQILDELLNHPGELVTREQLIRRLWPKGVVDFDTGLNSAVRKLRIALQDEVETPRYIETVPRKGYRFIGTIDDPAGEGAAVRTTSVTSGVARIYMYVGIAVALLIAALALGGLRRDSQPNVVTARVQTAPPPVSAVTIAVLPLRASSSDEASALIAASVTDLIRNRLAVLHGVTVLASASTSGLTDTRADMVSIGEKLRARFLVTGDADRVGERLHVDVALIDSQSDKQLWSQRFDRPITELAAIREAILERIAASLRISTEAATSDVSSSQINLDAYQLYMRGRQSLANPRATDAERTVEFFRRAAVLDPTFARAQLGLGQALRAQAALLGSGTSDLEAKAARAFDRALELDPALGEAWVEQAGLTPDAAKAEALYRKGLALTPSYGLGYAHYSNFLFAENRVGEAIDMILRARDIDPLSPALRLRHAGMVMIARSDVATHDQLVREAIAINPEFAFAFAQLAFSRWEFSGELAEAAQLIERAIAIDPQASFLRALARDIYLDLGDPVAAVAVLGEARPPVAMVEVAQYEGDQERAADLLKGIDPRQWPDSGAHGTYAAAIRDGAIARRSLPQAIKTLQAAYEIRRAPRMHYRAMTLVYAHTLLLAGEMQRGTQLATAMLAQIDTHDIGRTRKWFSRDRASALVILGDDERALNELAISVNDQHIYRWWYLAEQDPLYSHLRSHPRFQALGRQVKQQVDRQRAALDEMRRKGDVPTRNRQEPNPRTAKAS